MYWQIKIYDTEKNKVGYLSGDVHGSLVPKDEGWRLSNGFNAVGEAVKHTKDKPHLFYRVEEE
jgi:hypothetical protein